MQTFNVNSDDQFFLSSTSKGNQIKWVIDDKFIKADTMGYESVSEFIVSELESVISNLDFVKYSLCKINIDNMHEHYGCVCDIFTKDNESVVTIDRILNRYYVSDGEKIRQLKRLSGKQLIDEVVRICSEITRISYDDIMCYLAKMFKLDAIILNEDRHLNNISFIRNNDNEFSFAPIFDNGLSLLSDITDYPLDEGLSLLIRRVKAKPFNKNFIKQANYFSDYDLLHIDTNTLFTKLEKYNIEFKRKEFDRAVSVLYNRLSLLKGVVWDDF